MAQDNVSCFKILPFFGVSATELHSILEASVITKEDIVNYDFLNSLKSVYDLDVLRDLSFDYYIPDSFGKGHLRLLLPLRSGLPQYFDIVTLCNKWRTDE